MRDNHCRASGHPHRGTAGEEEPVEIIVDRNQDRAAVFDAGPLFMMGSVDPLQLLSVEQVAPFIAAQRAADLAAEST